MKSPSIRNFSKLLLAFILTVGGIASTHATVIADATSDSLGINLGGLEWLELSFTADLSRYDVEGRLDVIDGGDWRFASRSETEALLNSMGDPNLGWSTINFEGVDWFRNAFDAIENEPDSFLYYGQDGECDPDPTLSCYAEVAIDYDDGWIEFKDPAGKGGSFNTVSSLLVRVPEPGTFTLLLIGLSGIGYSRFLKRTKVTRV